MAQHDYSIANQTATSARTDINNALSAIVSNNSGAAEPSTTFANQWWYDTTNKKLKFRNEANTAWIEIGELNQTDNTFGGGTPSGAVVAFAMATAPNGWLACDGAAVSRTTYAVLFAAIGTTYGVGDGSTTFNLPDLRGEFVRGWDNGKGTDSGRTLGSAQGDETQDHIHKWLDYNQGSGSRTIATASSGTPVSVYDGQPTATFDLPTTIDRDLWTRTQTNLGNLKETRPINIALNYCIKY